MSTHPDTAPTAASDTTRTGMVRVRGASENNLRHVDVDVPRDTVAAKPPTIAGIPIQRPDGARD